MESNLAAQYGSIDLERWVDEHAPYLFRYAFRYFRSEEKAEELVQETFLAATESIQKFGGRSTPRTWLTGILRHKIMDLMRIKNRENPVDIGSLERTSDEELFEANGHWKNDTGPVTWNLTPDGALKQKQFLHALQECMKKLPEKMRQIFFLSEGEELSRDQIGSALELSATNIGVIMHRSRLSLQQCLQRSWFEGKQ